MPYLQIHQKPRVYVDVETTGLDPQRHEIIEFAATKDDGSFYETKIEPQHINRAEQEALDINGYTEALWADASKMDEVAPLIQEFLTDCVIVGHNVRFDMGFIAVMFKQANIRIHLDHHLVDTVTLAYEHLVPVGLQSLSLRKICEFLGIPPEPDVHRAMNGARCAQQVYHKLVRAGWFHRFQWRSGLRGGELASLGSGE
jgi:DNA polymerase-3 subunit epsilon